MLKGDVELAIDILADLITNATFPEDELVKEQEVVVQEIKQTIDTPDDIIFDFLQEQAFPNQPLGRTILGPAEKVRSFDKEKLRSYLSSNYAGEDMVVCAVGNIKHEDFVKMVENALARFSLRRTLRRPSKNTKAVFMPKNATLSKFMLFWLLKASNMTATHIIHVWFSQRFLAAVCLQDCFRKSVKSAAWFTLFIVLQTLIPRPDCLAFMPEQPIRN